MVNKLFCAFILSHGRADNVKTVKALNAAGYSGDLFFLVDNEDDQIEKYKENFGSDSVIVFDKRDIASRYDEADNFGDRRSIFYARNASQEIAKKMGYKYLWQLDDDYTHFEYRFDENREYCYKALLDINTVLLRMVEFLETSGAKTICMSQGGDFIGGKKSGMGNKIWLKRKAMNSFLINLDNPVEFKGKINEDVNAYVLGGQRGDLFFTTNIIMLNQTQTQKGKGGMSELYIDGGTYRKSFYSVMISPSSVRLNLMGNKHKRIHHEVNWNKTAVKRIKESVKKTV